MTIGPRNTPHPIILHVDDNGRPIRLAEASAIYATNVSAVTVVASTVSASQWLGLESFGGYPGGSTYEVQYKGPDGNFAAETAFKYDPTPNLLIVPNVYVGNLSSTNLATLDEVRATSFSSIGLSSTSFNTNTVNSNNIYATTISATTVCATNYDAQFNALSFSNLDARYLNSSGDSVTGSFSVQSLSAATISATTYLNLPSAVATWNASAIQGRSVTSTVPSLGESLVWLGTAWGPSAVAGGAGGSPGEPNLSIQFKNGSFFSGTENVKYNQSISGIQSIGLSSTDLLSKNISATVVSATSYLNLREGDPLWNANKIQDADVLKDILIANGDILVYTTPGGNWETHTPSEYADYIYPVIQNRIPSAIAVWNASAIRGIPVTSTAPLLNNVLIYNGSVWTPSASVALGSVASNNLASINSNSTNLLATNLSATNLSATNLSSTSARIVGLSATTISATDWQGLPSAVATWNASAIQGRAVTSTPPVANNVLIYNGSVWTPSSAISLGTIAATNLGGTDIVGTRANITNLSATTVSANNAVVNSLSSLNISSISARITGLSATTISATDWQGLPSAVATWNASALQGGKVLGANTPAGQLGFLSYNPTLNEYQAISLSSLGNNGNAVRGYGAASYLASANDNYFAINDGWQLFADYPENKDVLVFSSNMYGYGSPRWTWQQASSLVPAAGSYSHLIQIRGPNGEFSSIDGFTYNQYGLTVPLNIFVSGDNAYLRTKYLDVLGNINIYNGINASGNINLAGTVSATQYKIFGAATSSTYPSLAHNQNMVYDATGTKWKPGYRVFQATATPTAEIGSDGDIYFQYLP